MVCAGSPRSGLCQTFEPYDQKYIAMLAGSDNTKAFSTAFPLSLFLRLVAWSHARSVALLVSHVSGQKSVGGRAEPRQARQVQVKALSPFSVHTQPAVPARTRNFASLAREVEGKFCRSLNADAACSPLLQLDVESLLQRVFSISCQACCSREPWPKHSLLQQTLAQALTFPLKYPGSLLSFLPSLSPSLSFSSLNATLARREI